MAETRMILFEVKSHTWEQFSDDIKNSDFDSHFVNERLIHEIGSANTQIENMHFLHDSIIESIEKPRGVRDLNDLCVSLSTDP